MVVQFSGLMTATVFLPVLGALIILFLLRGDSAIRRFAAAVAVIDLLLAGYVFLINLPGGETTRPLLIDRMDWIITDRFAASYYLHADGLSAPLILLTGLLGLCAVLVSWNVTHRVKEYFIWLLTLQTAVIGVFAANDLLLFFLFWELELVPMYMLISTWGTGRREYSAMKFLIFTILGSAAMLVAIVAVFVNYEPAHLWLAMPANTLETAETLALPMAAVFWLFFIAFAVKLPVWPVHTWLPDAHTDAPTAASVMLAGVMLKMGGYGMLRINAGLFPEHTAQFAWLLMLMGVISVLYGAVVTLKQTDLKRLIAYSSVSHMGLVLCGIASVGITSGELTPAGLNGAAMQLFTHGTITGLLFICVGLVYDRTHTRYIPDLGGLTNRMPRVTIAFLIAGLASLGLPGLSGFVSEILVFFGAFAAFPWMTALAVLGIILAAGYILWMVQRTFFGPRREQFDELPDATWVETVPLALLIVAIVAVGVFPGFLVGMFEMELQSTTAIIQSFQQQGASLHLASP